MFRVFIELPSFLKSWTKIGLSEEDLWELEDFLAENPESGDTVAGTGGLRKIRWAAKGRGKRGGARVCYVDFVRREKLYSIAAYSKNEKSDISPEEKAQIKKLIDQLK
ncbi:type II toxin-antitoxin system RelE/ParE family toxin [Turneriella parva]|uniref:type II toxin-antitoxin system RelE/ParE family toxin n=1 Tax=Turneriella parva TaxID=29510 RepID=UPI0005A532AB|nr:type II toxin-antitoxin system RelE/ParE family toxin [Turneriella parva]